jgi:hypothetical protein
VPLAASKAPDDPGPQISLSAMGMPRTLSQESGASFAGVCMTELRSRRSQRDAAFSGQPVADVHSTNAPSQLQNIALRFSCVIERDVLKATPVHKNLLGR